MVLVDLGVHRCMGGRGSGSKTHDHTRAALGHAGSQSFCFSLEGRINRVDQHRGYLRVNIGGPLTRLAVVGDVHAHLKRLSVVLDRACAVGVDGVLLVGDLACAGRGARTRAQINAYRRQVDAVFDAITSRNMPFCYVPGNHDLEGLSYPGNVDGRCEDFLGYRVAGIGGTNPPHRGFAYEWTDDDIRNLALPPCDILISHCPPLNTPLDFARGAGRHVGSAAIREQVEGMQGVMVCGHIHESYGVCQIDACLCLNAGGLGRPFGRTQVGFILDLDTIRHEDLETGQVQILRRSQPIEHTTIATIG